MHISTDNPEEWQDAWAKARTVTSTSPLTVGGFPADTLASYSPVQDDVVLVLKLGTAKRYVILGKIA